MTDTLARLQRPLQVLFLLSGATALIYQVVWTRMLTLFFGSTTLAVSTVLAVFMGGLAIGSAWLGRRADGAAEPVRFYGWLELVIGLLAMATPLTFAVMQQLYLFLYGQIAPGFWGAVLLRFALSALLLLPPTIMMGGTLPVLSKVFLDEHLAHTTRAISLLYFINTLGAVIGTLAAGLILLQWMGIQALLIAAGLINVGIFAYTRRLPRLNRSANAQAEAGDAGGWSVHALAAVAILFFSGMAALVYEVAWTRVLTLVIGSSTYAFTLMLATFLVGIALGSALVGRYAKRRKPGLTLLAVCQVLIGMLALATAALFGWLPDAFVALFGAVGETYWLFLLANFLLCFLVMVPATLFMGASFPVASALVVERFGSSGRRIGLLYAGNTVGAILGAFLAGFVLLPGLGIQQTLLLTVLVNLASGLVLGGLVLARSRTGRDVWVPAAGAACILLLLIGVRPGWDRLRMTSGPYAYAVQYQEMPIDARLRRLEPLYYREGPMATVSVIREGAHLRLTVDGKTDAGNFRDMTTQVLAGHLPLLAKPHARRVLVIGYASGITAGAVGRHAVERIDCVEIEPAMREASEFFREENYHIADDPRFRLIIDDARAHVLASGGQYDVIISEPSNPWQAGSSRLFTREAFANAKTRLRPGGLMAQWMHLYGVDLETFRLVVRTFQSVYPHVSLWADPDYPDVIFLGSDAPIGFDPNTLAGLFQRNGQVTQSLARIGYPDAASVFRAFLLDEEEVRRFASGGPLNTDNLPLLEFRAPRSLYSSTALAENLRALQAAKAPESFPPVRVESAQAAQAAALLKAWGLALADRRFVANARGAFLRATEADSADAEAHMLLGLIRMQTGDPHGAMQAFTRALAADPGRGEVHAHLGTLYLQAGNHANALAHLDKAIALGKDSSGVRNNLAILHARAGHMAEAVREARLAVAMDPDNRVAQENLINFQKRLETQ